MTDRQRSNSILAAVIVGTGFILSSGAAYKALAGHLARPADNTPLTQQDMDKLPADIGLWSGIPVQMDERIVRATDTDAHINRVYRKQGSLKSVWLYVAYGVQSRDLMPHRPEVCYPGNGWTLSTKQSDNLQLNDKTTVDCTVYEFTKASIGADTITVLNFYIIDGRFAPDVSALRAKAWRGQAGVHYMAQVQITTSADTLRDTQQRINTLQEFASVVTPHIIDLFPHANADEQ